MITSSPVVPVQINGFRAFRLHCRLIQDIHGSREIFLKIGHNHFIRVPYLNESGHFSGYHTRLRDKDDSSSRYDTEFIPDVWAFLEKWMHQNEGGLFILPYQPQGMPRRENVQYANVLTFEPDRMSKDEQLAMYEEFTEITGIEFLVKLASGGKSVHAWIGLDRPYEWHRVQHLIRCLILAFRSDCASANAWQPMRFAGGYRKEKDAEQAVISFSDCRYSLEEIELAARKYFTHKGLTIPDRITDEWWRQFLPNLKKSNIPEEAREPNIRRLLDIGIDGWEEQQRQLQREREERRQKHLEYVEAHGEQISDRIKQAEIRLGADVFDAVTNWKYQGGKARGRCPFHSSSSGNSAYIRPIKGGSGEWGFACPQCTEDKPMSGFRFHIALKHNDADAPYPTGKEFVEEAREFCKRAGVDLPEWKPSQRKNDKVIQLKPQADRFVVALPENSDEPKLVMGDQCDGAIVITNDHWLTSGFTEKRFGVVELSDLSSGVVSGAGSRTTLSESLEPIVQKGREVYLYFNWRYVKKGTKISAEIYRLGALLEAEGCKVRVVSVDDIVGRTIEQAMALSLPFAQWLVRRYNSLSYDASEYIDRRYIGSVAIPESARLIWFKAPKGTGKTYTMAQQVKQLREQGYYILLVTHRIQLCQALCNEFGIQSIYDLLAASEGKKEDSIAAWERAIREGYGLVINSMHFESQAQFDIDSVFKRSKVAIVIDEVEQVLWHELDGNTCRDNRIAILSTHRELIKKALAPDAKHKVILADADLTDVSLNFFVNTSGTPDLETWGLINDYKPEDEWHLVSYDRKELLLAELKNQLAAGGKVFICTDSQKAKGKFSSTNLEAALEAEIKQHYPNARILRVDSQTLQLKDHPAFGCISKLNELLPEYDVVIASPAIETGVSIDFRGHFTAVFGLFQGQLSPNSVRQSLMRVRENVPRFIWVAKRGLSTVGRGELSVNALRDSQNKIVKSNIQAILDSAKEIEGYDVEFFDEAFTCWAQMAVRHNAGVASYRDSVLRGLIEEGYVLKRLDASIEDAETIDAVKEEMTAVRDKSLSTEAKSIAEARDIDPDVAQEMIDRRSHECIDDVYAVKRYILKEKYGTEDITDELVIKDGEGWHPALRLQYYLTIGRQYLKGRDQNRAEGLSKDGKLWTPDANRVMLSSKVVALETIGFTEIFNSTSEYRNDDPVLIEFAAKVKELRRDIKTVLGVTIREDDSPVVVCRNLLSLLGLKLKCTKKERYGKTRVRVYEIEGLNDGRDEILGAWLQRDIDRESNFTDKPIDQVTDPTTEASKVMEACTLRDEYKRKVPDTRQRVTIVRPFPCSPIVPGEYMVAERDDEAGMIRLLINGKASPTWIGSSYFLNTEHQKEVRVG